MEKTAATVTSWLVGSVVLAAAVGASGATLSMFVTLIEVTSEKFPASSWPRKETVAFASSSTPLAG